MMRSIQRNQRPELRNNMTLSAPVLVVIALTLLVADIALFGGVSIILPILAIGVLAAAAASALGLEPTMQVVTGAVASVLSVPLVVLISRRLRQTRPVTSDDQRLLEETFVITESKGRPGIRHRGEFLPARHQSHAILSAGDRVRVVRVEGVTAVVEHASEKV